MAIVAIVLACLGFILGLAGFGAGCWSVVQVLGWQRSTHRITHIPPEIQETRIESDVPQHVLDQLPSPPEKLTLEQYAKWQERQDQVDELERSVWDE